MPIFFTCCSPTSSHKKKLPWGIDKMSQKKQQKFQLGNDHAEWLSRVIQLCRQHKIRFWVENPDSSFLWFLPCWEALGARDTNSCFRLDYCVCGCPWRKRTRFFTDLHLKGQHSFCTRDHKHLRLVGWSRLHRKAWTRVAQVYPRRLVQWVSFAVLSDAGLLPGRKKSQLRPLLVRPTAVLVKPRILDQEGFFGPAGLFTCLTKSISLNLRQLCLVNEFGGLFGIGLVVR